MSKGVLNTFLLIAFVVMLILNWAGPQDPNRRNLEYFPDMSHSARYNTFAPNPDLPDGQTLQQPVAGTIPRGFHPLDYKATPEDAKRAGEELFSPLSVLDAQALKRGQFIFTNFCRPCHGAGARGDGPVTLRGFPAPPSLLADHAIKMRDGQMLHVLTYGQMKMPSYRAQISPEDRWKAILYVRSLQKQEMVQTSPLPQIPGQVPSQDQSPTLPKGESR